MRIVDLVVTVRLSGNLNSMTKGVGICHLLYTLINGTRKILDCSSPVGSNQQQRYMKKVVRGTTTAAGGLRPSGGWVAVEVK